MLCGWKEPQVLQGVTNPAGVCGRLVVPSFRVHVFVMEVYFTCQPWITLEVLNAALSDCLAVLSAVLLLDI